MSSMMKKFALVLALVMAFMSVACADTYVSNKLNLKHLIHVVVEIPVETPAASDEPEVTEPSVEEPAAVEPAATAEVTEPEVVEPVATAEVTEADETVEVTETKTEKNDAADPEEVIDELENPDNDVILTTLEDELNPDRCINIHILFNGDAIRYGDTVRLVAELIGYDNAIYDLQWQESADEGETWTDIEDEIELAYTFVMTEEKAMNLWRIEVSIYDVIREDAEEVTEPETTEAEPETEATEAQPEAEATEAQPEAEATEVTEAEPEAQPEVAEEIKAE